MLMEDQFGVGDVVDLGEASGTVERVTLRVTTLRGVDGTVWYVPNGEIVRVGNKSQRWARTVLDVEVAYDTDLDHASAVIKRVADDFWKEQMPGATVIEEPELWGVQNVSPSAVVLRLAVKTRPGEQCAAGRALRARLKTAFDEAGIAAPAPASTMWLPGSTGGRRRAARRLCARSAAGRDALVTKYRDTRGLVERPRTFTEALLDGIAPGGGLYVPERLPSLTASDLLRLSTQPLRRARRRRSTRPSAWTSPPTRIADIAAQAYGDNFDDPGRGARPRPRRRPLRARALARPDARLQGHGPAVHAAVLQRGARAGPRSPERPTSTSSSWSRPRATPASRRSTASPTAPTRASPSTTRTPASRRSRNGR